MSGETMTATIIIDAPAETVFGVLADPASHAAIDGTGWVREPLDVAPISEVGQVFRMAMYHQLHPDGDYRMANKVVVFDSPRAIAWQPGREDNGELIAGGWSYRYDLTPAGPAKTKVTLHYDWSEVPESVREQLPAPLPPFSVDKLDNSLKHLAELARPAGSS